MTEDLLRQRLADAHEHRGPDDRVEAHDLLADKMHVCRPVFLVIVIAVVAVAQGCRIIKQRIDPDVDDMPRVKIHGDAPGEGGPRDTEVLQAGLDEVVDHFVDAATGLQKICVFQQVLHPVGVLREAEEVGLLLGLVDLAAAVRALAIHQLGLGPERFAGRAVLALVGPLVDIAIVVHLFEDLLNRFDMIVICCADEAVIGDVHQLPQVLDTAFTDDDIIYKLLGRDAGLLGLFFDLHAVLVRSGQEHDIAAPEPLVTGHGVRCDGAVGMPDVQLGGRVIDRCGDIEFFSLLVMMAHKKNPPFSKRTAGGWAWAGNRIETRRVHAFSIIVSRAKPLCQHLAALFLAYPLLGRLYGNKNRPPAQVLHRWAGCRGDFYLLQMQQAVHQPFHGRDDLIANGDHNSSNHSGSSFRCFPLLQSIASPGGGCNARTRF